MMRYNKGARGERELLNYLHERGFSVMRSAGSGVNSLSPDIIAFKDGRGFAFECKAWERGSIAIEVAKIEEMMRWEANTKMDTYIAWRMNGVGWYFIKLSEMNKATANYTVTKKNAVKINRRLEIFDFQG
jgi:holliday junction resolvase Hjr